ncbi:hypothetical protein MMC18_007477 [Xylographa bjoerkii]|nr:hypothetical protein [Xylographa bjoerkii]
MNFVPLRLIAFGLAAILAVFLLFSIAYREPSHPSVATRWWHASTVGDVMASIQNSTLGFEKILVLNMPERSDKRDALSLAASLTNLKFDYVDGVLGKNIPSKALPVGQEQRTMPNSTLGSWRAHMNAIRGVVEQNLSSALILEDDADWDIRIKSQLLDFAKGSRYLLNQPPTQQTHSPYGDGWDILWLGFCHDIIPENDPRTYLIDNDVSIPQPDKMYFNNPELFSHYPNHTRIVHMVGSPICTFGYAVSFQGARKILYALSVKELRGIFDNALSWWCTDHGQDSVCIDAHPSYFYQHRAAGASGKNSDINEGLPPMEKGQTYNIRWSTRLNLEKLVMGQTDFEDSFPDGP